ncbi:MAG: hypothetical protein NZZ41_04090 [Candidatus Dojkabacteria bacterium]|nr:hypothetical protein [Candidatus Dojkabacteria bacterium]
MNYFKVSGVSLSCRFGKNGNIIRNATSGLEIRNPTDTGYSNILFNASQANNGTASSPAYSFFSENNTGLFLQGVNQLSLSVDGNGSIIVRPPSTANPTLTITGTSSIQLPSGTTANRPTSTLAGQFRYNTSISSGSLEFRDSTQWRIILDNVNYTSYVTAGQEDILYRFTHLV